MSNSFFRVAPGTEKTHREAAGKNIAGFTFRGFYNINPSIPAPAFGTRWGLFGDGRKRVDYDKAYITVTLKRKGQSIPIMSDISLQDLLVLSNFGNSTYELARYADNGSFPTASADQLQHFFAVEFPTGAISLGKGDELHVKLRVENSFCALNGTTTATVTAGGAPLTYVSAQATGLPFIDKDTSRLEVAFIEDSNFAVETSLPHYKSVNIEVGASTFPVGLGENVVRCTFIDYAFGRLPVDVSTNENVVSLVSAQVRSEQLTNDLPLASLWSDTTRSVRTWQELVPRRGHITLLGDPTNDNSPATLVDYDDTTVTLSLRPALVKDQKQRILSIAYSVSAEQKALAGYKIEQIKQKHASKF